MQLEDAKMLRSVTLSVFRSRPFKEGDLSLSASEKGFRTGLMVRLMLEVNNPNRDEK
jgi:hypothetical protein